LKSKSGLQVLVVEDEPIIRMLIEIGYKNIKVVASIDNALHFLADNRELCWKLGDGVKKAA